MQWNQKCISYSLFSSVRVHVSCINILITSLEDPRDLSTYDTAVWPEMDSVICKVPSHLSLLELGDSNVEQVASRPAYFSSLRSLNTP